MCLDNHHQCDALNILLTTCWNTKFKCNCQWNYKLQDEDLTATPNKQLMSQQVVQVTNKVAHEFNRFLVN
jgi:hypothetical protein